MSTNWWRGLPLGRPWGMQWALLVPVFDSCFLRTSFWTIRTHTSGQIIATSLRKGNQGNPLILGKSGLVKYYSIWPDTSVSRINYLQLPQDVSPTPISKVVSSPNGQRQTDRKLRPWRKVMLCPERCWKLFVECNLIQQKWSKWLGGLGFSPSQNGRSMEKLRRWCMTWFINLGYGWPSKNMGKPPNHPLKNRVFHYKPSILGYSYFWKHPYIFRKISSPPPQPPPQKNIYSETMFELDWVGLAYTSFCCYLHATMLIWDDLSWFWVKLSWKGCDFWKNLAD